MRSTHPIWILSYFWTSFRYNFRERNRGVKYNNPYTWHAHQLPKIPYFFFLPKIYILERMHIPMANSWGRCCNALAASSWPFKEVGIPKLREKLSLADCNGENASFCQDNRQSLQKLIQSSMKNPININRIDLDNLYSRKSGLFNKRFYKSKYH